MNKLIPFLLLLILFSCNGNKNSNESAQAEKENNESSILPDSLFKFNMSKIDILIDTGFARTIEKKELVTLDSIQKAHFIGGLGKMYDRGIEIPYRFFTARFVSKLEKRGDLTPIIIDMGGDDYGSLLYILLDNKSDPVSYYKLWGGFCAGEDEGKDGTLVQCPERTSLIKADGIYSYITTERIKVHSGPTLVDSVRYFTKILPSGKIETNRIDSTRYVRKTKK